MLLHETIKDLKPLLKEGSPDCWAEICAIAVVRATGNVPLKQIKDAWGKLYNAENMNPHLSPKKLSRIIRELGVNRAGQNIIFNELDIGGKILIVSDMDVEKLEIYLLYKKREVVEKMFDTYKTVLNADKLYLQDDESVFGHVRIHRVSFTLYPL
jgi:hypothetical protein